MPASAEAQTPPEKKHTSSSYRDELAYYKAQYEQLESELTDFQLSSRELETEMEKDIEAAEKRERQLKEKVDTLRYEVDEWKVCFSYSSELISFWRRSSSVLRPNTNSLNLKPTTPKTRYKRRSLLCVRPAALFS